MLLTYVRASLRCALPLLLTVSAFAPAYALPIGEAPPMSLGVDADRKALSTTDYVGQVLVVTFWASWCGPCIQEMSALERLQQLAPEQLAVVSVNIESAARFRQVRRALQKKLQLTLSHDRDGSVAQAWGVKPIPHMFMIDHEGRLAYEHRGYGDDFIPMLVERINHLLARQASDR